jgi:iron complex transport system substrate-binding protein
MQQKALPAMVVSVFHLMPYKALLFLVGLLAMQPVAAAPRRFVSMNLCTDQLLMMLADREEIVSLSHLSRRKDLSVMAEQAMQYPVNHGLAEEIMRFKPDIVFAGVFSRPATVFMLKHLGYRVEVLPVASGFNTIVQNIRTLAGAVGHSERGEQLIARFNQRLQTFKKSLPAERPVVVLYRENHYTTGKNTLANVIIETAGFENLAASLGISGSGHLPLERLLMHPVDLLIQGRRRSPDGSVAAAALMHPAYQHYVADRKSINIDDRLWICGTPYVLKAVDQLMAQHRARP